MASESGIFRIDRRYTLAIVDTRTGMYRAVVFRGGEKIAVSVARSKALAVRAAVRQVREMRRERRLDKWGRAL